MCAKLFTLISVCCTNYLVHLYIIDSIVNWYEHYCCNRIVERLKKIWSKKLCNAIIIFIFLNMNKFRNVCEFKIQFGERQAFQSINQIFLGYPKLDRKFSSRPNARFLNVRRHWQCQTIDVCKNRKVRDGRIGNEYVKGRKEVRKMRRGTLRVFN